MQGVGNGANVASYWLTQTQVAPSVRYPPLRISITEFSVMLGFIGNTYEYSFLSVFLAENQIKGSRF